MNELNPLRSTQVGGGDQVREADKVDTELDGSGAGGGFLGRWRKRRDQEASPQTSAPAPTALPEEGDPPLVVQELDRLRSTGPDPVPIASDVQALRGRSVYERQGSGTRPAVPVPPASANQPDEDPFAETETETLPPPEPTKPTTASFTHPAILAEQEAIRALRGRMVYNDPITTRTLRRKDLPSPPGQ